MSATTQIEWTDATWNPITMPDRIDLRQNSNNVGGGFEWEKPPACCDQLRFAVEGEKYMFVSNLTDREGNAFYMLPLNSEGRVARTGGVQIIYCPWCGTKVSARKK